jgi:tetratricopeptide (TPR) repeat protein
MLWAQEERKVIREGNKAYNEGNYDEAELKYQKAMETNPQLFELYSNTANAHIVMPSLTTLL